MINHHLRRVTADSSKLPIEFIGSSSGSGNVGSPTLVLNSPSNTLPGDLLVIVGVTAEVAADYLLAGSPVGVSDLTGQLGISGMDIATCTSTAGGTGSSVSVSASHSSAAFQASMLVFRYARWGGVGYLSSQASIATAQSITTTVKDSVVAAWFGIRNHSAGMTITVPGGYSTAVVIGGSGFPRFGVYYKTLATAGATGDVLSAIGNGGVASGNQFWLEPA